MDYTAFADVAVGLHDFIQSLKLKSEPFAKALRSGGGGCG
jgi:hypothetical protein